MLNIRTRDMGGAVSEHPPSRNREAAPGSLAEALIHALGSDRVLNRLVDRRTYSYDAYLDESLPEAVAFPRSASEAAIAVTVANAEHRPFVPRGECVRYPKC